MMKPRNGLLSECTIIIPTYNRPNYLKRILDYYNKYCKGARILIADSSSPENKQINKKTALSFKDVYISYLNKYPQQTLFYDKLLDALTNINTNYCVVCADDDFITPTGISESTAFLEKNPDFTLVHGRYIHFYLSKDVQGEPVFHWKWLYPFKSSTSDNPVDRFKEHSIYLQPTFYALYRTPFLRLILNETAKNTDDVEFGEWLPSLLALIYGKMKCLDVLYAAREYAPPSISNKYDDLIAVMNSGTYEEKYLRFRKCVTKHLQVVSNIDATTAEDLVDKAMLDYKQMHYPVRGLNFSQRQKIKVLLRHLGLYQWAMRAYKKIFLHASISANPTKAVAESLGSPYYADLNYLRNHVLSNKISIVRKSELHADF